MQVGWGLETLMERSLGAARVAAGVRLFRQHYATVYATQTKLLPQVAPSLVELPGQRVFTIGISETAAPRAL